MPCSIPNQLRTGEPILISQSVPAGACLVFGCTEGLGLLIWMIGLWLVTARYAFKGIRPVGPATLAARIARPAMAPAA